MTDPVTLYWQYDLAKESPEGTRSSGKLWVSSSPENVEAFTDLLFLDMVRLVHESLRAKGADEVMILRKKGSLAFPLAPVAVAAIRENPEKAFLEHFYVPPFQPAKTVEEAPVLPVLRAGFDTLVDSFGEDVYIRDTGTQVECPFCGNLSTPLVELCCASCGSALAIKRDELRPWARMRVQDLLDVKAEKFFLPRAWNPNTSGWIAHAELQALFATWQEAKKEM